MNSHHLRLALGVLAVLALIGLGYWLLSSGRPQATFPETSEISSAADTADWGTYTNTEYGFELMHPLGSTVETVRTDKETYVRIENISSDSYRLPSGEYYLEIYIRTPAQSCMDELGESREVTLSGSPGYRGTAVDAFGQRFILCSVRDGRQYLIRATEDADMGPIANAILDSFRFTSE